MAQDGAGIEFEASCLQIPVPADKLRWRAAPIYLLDTNIISELRQGRLKPSRGVRAWAASMTANQFFLSGINILELAQGALALERRSGLIADAALASADIDRSTMGQKALADHAADAVGAARDRLRRSHARLFAS